MWSGIYVPIRHFHDVVRTKLAFTLWHWYIKKAYLFYMFFRKKKPKRLYYPAKSRWYSKPRRRPTVKRAHRLFKKGFKGWLKDLTQKSFYWVVTGIAFAGLLTFLFFSSYLSITRIEVIRENFNVDSAAIENKLNIYIGKNIFFISKNSIAHTINTYFPEFSEVTINKIFPEALKISLKSYPIVANLKAYYVLPEPEIKIEDDFSELNKAIEELSGSDPGLAHVGAISPLNDEKVAEAVFDIEEGGGPEPIEQKCLINRIGQAIFDQEENLELMTITVHGLTQPIEDRGQVIPREHMDYILEAMQYFTNSMGMEILGVEYFSVAREIHLKTAGSLIIWISIDRDFKDQIDKLHVIYEPAELNKEDLRYIDLRIRNKVIYCPKNARCDH